MTESVKISKEFIDTLESLYPINQSLRIVKDNTQLKTVNPQKTTVAYTTIKETFSRDINIYDLREFITVLNIIKEPEIDVSDDGIILIKSSDGGQRLRYADAEPSLIQSYFEKDVKFPGADVTVTITENTLKAVQRAAQALSLPFIGFVSENGNIMFKAFSKNNGSNEETNGYAEKVGETDDNFELFYSASALNILKGDCAFEISKHLISQVETGNYKYFISLDPKSKFESTDD